VDKSRGKSEKDFTAGKLLPAAETPTGNYEKRGEIGSINQENVESKTNALFENVEAFFLGWRRNMLLSPPEERFSSR
jgi:hypothetical protein